MLRGKREQYRIDIGSGNVIMAPSGRFLCIVAGPDGSHPGPAAGALVLPFEGDAMLSLIMSKAFLLAADDRITDPAILSQMEG